MDSDRNLLFGIISMQAGLITSEQFVDTCARWANRKDAAIADLLIEHGLINETDRSHVDYLVQRRIEKCAGDLQVSLASVPNALRLTLSKVADPDIQRSLPPISRKGMEPGETQVWAIKSPVDLESTDRYELIQLHAVGGIGRVWNARDTKLSRPVALKELKPQLANDDSMLARFHREATITGQLNHPGIVPVYDFVAQSDSSPSFYTMRFVKGRTLAEAAREFHDHRARGEANTATFVQLLNAFVMVCKTIAYAHSQGVIHRDLKGENVVLGDFGETIVLDWGLAKQLISDVSEDSISTIPPIQSEAELTMRGGALGTPSYMAPEQAAGQLGMINQQTDIYGLGAILYLLLTGNAPFTAPGIEEVLVKVRFHPPTLPREVWADVPASLEAACLRALAKEQSGRFPTPLDLAHEVERWQEVELNRAEAALRASEERYALAISGSRDGIWDWNVVTNELYYSPRLKELFGFEDHEFPNVFESWSSRLHPDDRERVMQAVNRMLEGVPYDIEYRFLTRSSQYRWVRAKGLAFHDENGRPIRAAGSVSEVSEPKRA